MQATILFLGAAQGLFFAIAILKKGTNPKASLVLSIFLLVQAVSLTNAGFVLNGLTDTYTFIIRVAEPLQFLSGPLIYIYVYTLIKGVYPSKIIISILSLPFIAWFIYSFPFYFIPANEKINFQTSIITGQAPLSYTIGFYLKSIFGLFMLWLSIRMTYQKVSYLTKPIVNNVKGLRVLLIFFAAIWLVAFIRPLFGFNTQSIFIVGLIVVGLIYWISWLYMHWPAKVASGIKADKVKYQKSLLTHEEGKDILISLVRFFDNEKPYLQKTCSLSSIAKLTGLKSHHISQVLNSIKKQSFNEFVNEYRAKEAALRIIDLDHDHLSIDAIGEMVGFGSKATFYKSFQHYFKVTPSQYRKQHFN